MIDERRRLGEVPLRLVCASADLEAAAARGAVLLLHGFSSDISHQTKELESLAADGWLAIGVDVVDHGARRAPDFAARYGARFEGAYAALLRRARAELPGLVDELCARGWARPPRLALAGISMGGFITYGAAAVEPRIPILIPILGSPRWDEGADSPHQDPGAFLSKALLSLTAGADLNVPPGDARALHAALQREPGLRVGRSRYREFAGCPHTLPEADWAALWEEVRGWLRRHLSAAPGGAA